VARQIWDWALAGHRKAAIADLANRAGYRRRSGLPWSTEAVTQLLLSRTYAGFVPFARHVRMHGRLKRQPDRAQWYLGGHPALVSLAEWEMVQRTVNTAMGRPTAHRTPRSELAGLARCALCDGPLVALAYTADGGYHYNCARAVRHEADHPPWSRRDWVIHLAIRRVLDEALADFPPVPPLDVADNELARELERLQAQHSRLRTLYELGEYGDDLDRFSQRSRELQAQIAQVRSRLGSGVTPAGWAERWHAFPGWEAGFAVPAGVRDRQRLWGAILERVWTDASRVRVRLRHFGPDVPQDWEVDLPPLRTRRPGTRCGRGIVGQRRGRTRAGGAAGPAG